MTNSPIGFEQKESNNWNRLFDHIQQQAPERLYYTELQREVRTVVEASVGDAGKVPEDVYIWLGALDPLSSKEIDAIYEEVVKADMVAASSGVLAVREAAIEDITVRSLDEFAMIWSARFKRYGLEEPVARADGENVGAKIYKFPCK